MAEEFSEHTEVEATAEVAATGEVTDRLWDAHSLTLAAIVYSLLAAIAMYLTSGCALWVRIAVSVAAMLGLGLGLLWRPARSTAIKWTRSLLFNP